MARSIADVENIDAGESERRIRTVGPLSFSL